MSEEESEKDDELKIDLTEYPVIPMTDVDNHEPEEQNSAEEVKKLIPVTNITQAKLPG